MATYSYGGRIIKAKTMRQAERIFAGKSPHDRKLKKKLRKQGKRNARRGK